MPIVPGQTTLGQIRLAAQRRADLATSSPDTAEWTDNVIGSLFRLYGVIVRAYGNNYKVKLPTYTFVTDGSSDWYPLPADFFKLLLVQWQQSPGNNTYNLTLERVNLQEIGRLSTPALLAGAGGLAPHYCDVGDQLMLAPRAGAGLTIVLWYIPRMTIPAESGTITLSGVVNGQALTINGVTFTAGAGLFVGPGDAAFAAGLAAAINASTLAGSLAAIANGNVVALQIANLLQPLAVVVTNPATSFACFPDTVWTNLVDGVNGWEELVVLDVAIKLRDKLEFDTSGLERQKAAMLRDLEAETRNRDAGMAKTMVNVRRSPWGY